LHDIEKMLQDINHPKIGAVDFEAPYQDAKGEWRKEYLLPNDPTVTLITGCAEVSLRDGERALAIGMAAKSRRRRGAMSGLWRVSEAGCLPPACGSPRIFLARKSRGRVRRTG
jgi:hypothetical protein